jgi:glycerol dehydrogenase
MRKAMISPSRYVQEEGALAKLGESVKAFGSRAVLVASKGAQERVRDSLDQALSANTFELISAGFNLECTRREIERIGAMVREKGADVIIGLGGGKSLDTAKAVGHLEGKPVIVVPTIASTDAPTSALAVIYTEKGEFEEYFFVDRNPDLVLVDTAVIAKAPVRFLVAGMGDALATYFEARSCMRADAPNQCVKIPGARQTKTAMAIAEMCYRTLLEDSVKAKAACEAKVVTPALENIIEASILMSGLGFESAGLAAAHSVHNGLTVLEETHTYYHGEKVAFGTIVHLALENAPSEELKTVMAYCRSVGLPTRLKDLGITDPSPERLMAVATASVAEGETIHHMPFKVNADMVHAAILAADKLGV